MWRMSPSRVKLPAKILQRKLTETPPVIQLLCLSSCSLRTALIWAGGLRIIETLQPVMWPKVRLNRWISAGHSRDADTPQGWQSGVLVVLLSRWHRVETFCFSCDYYFYCLLESCGGVFSSRGKVRMIWLLIKPTLLSFLIQWIVFSISLKTSRWKGKKKKQ